MAIRRNSPLLAFGVVVGFTILNIMYHLNTPSTSSHRLTFQDPPSFLQMSTEQSIITTISTKKPKIRIEFSGHPQGTDGDSVVLAMRKERRHFIRLAREQGEDLRAGEKVFQLFPPAFTCPYKEERIGGRYTGKWACGIRELYGPKKGDSQSSPNCIMYSFGVGPEIAFDEAVLGITNCKVFAFDHTIKHGLPSITNESRDPQRMVFQKIGVEEYHKYNSNLKTIKQLMELNGHDWIDILKIDAEGAEYGSLNMLIDDFGDSGILPFDQLLVEIHLHDFDLYGLIIPWFNRLEAMGLRAVHWERNPFCNCFEYNFVNVRGKVFRNSTFDFLKIDGLT